MGITHQFIKEHGIEKARKVIEAAPESDQPLYFNTVNSIYFFTGYRNRYFVNGVWGNEDDHPSMYEYDIKAVSIADLKRLVYSVDLVGKYGGVSRARGFIIGYTAEQLAKPVYSPILILKQAIADYESIYSGEENGKHSKDQV